MIADYAGTVLIVSHDRDFLDRTTTSIVCSEGRGQWAVYAGGYSDMVTQRGSGVTAKIAATVPNNGEETLTVAPSAPAQSKRKLSFKEKHALETLPGRMETLEADIAKLEDKMATPNLFAKDPETFTKTASTLEKARTKLAKAEEEWLELEMLRAELGA